MNGNLYFNKQLHYFLDSIKYSEIQDFSVREVCLNTNQQSSRLAHDGRISRSLTLRAREDSNL